MIIEPTATTTEQITGNSSSTATTPARPPRVLFAKRKPATPIRKLRLAPSGNGLTLSTQRARLTIAHSGVPLDQGEEILRPIAGATAVSASGQCTPCRSGLIGRTRAVELLISERNALIRDAAKFYPGCGDREVARQLLIALARYRNGRWLRDRSEATCPAQHRGKLVQVLWLILRTIDAIPSDRTARAALAQSRTQTPSEFADRSTRCPATDE